MTELLILTNEHLRCEIKPALGGCVAGLWFQGIPVLRSTPAQSLVSVRESGAGILRVMWVRSSDKIRNKPASSEIICDGRPSWKAGDPMPWCAASKQQFFN